jgi:hypothetical protein
MSQTLTVPDDLYARLDAAARRRGLSIEDLLRTWQAEHDAGAMSDELRYRRVAVARLENLRSELASRVGEMPDSTDLIRADRTR